MYSSLLQFWLFLSLSLLSLQFFCAKRTYRIALFFHIARSRVKRSKPARFSRCSSDDFGSSWTTVRVAIASFASCLIAPSSSFWNQSSLQCSSVSAPAHGLFWFVELTFSVGLAGSSENRTLFSPVSFSVLFFCSSSVGKDTLRRVHVLDATC